MDQTTIIIIGAIVVAALVVLLLVRGRRQSVSLGDVAKPLPVALRASVADEEPHGVAAGPAAALEDVAGDFLGVDAHPDPAAHPAGPSDPLTAIKGLGPKAAARLTELGVTRFAQIAAWNAADVAAIDAEMGAFKGRIDRDRWVDQAKLLAVGDRDAFEAEFGRLG